MDKDNNKKHKQLSKEEQLQNKAWGQFITQALTLQQPFQAIQAQHPKSIQWIVGKDNKEDQ